MKTLPAAAIAFLLVFGATQGATEPVLPRIAFQAPVAISKRTSYNQIFSMNADGSGVTQLTSSTAGASAPRWSPGQQYIVFWRNNALYVMEAMGEANGGRTFIVGPAGGYGADWSPDGSSLVYRGTNSNLYIVAINADSGTVGTPVLFRSGVYFDPSWSPDGTRIAFWGSDDGNTDSRIHVRNVATGDEISFGTFSTAPDSLYYYNGPAQWSPDGTLIAFAGPAVVTTTTKKGITTSTAEEIFVASPDGSNIRQVTSLNSFSDFPTWSPDGTALAFRNGQSIYTMVLSSDTANLLHSPGNHPDWNP